RRRHAGRPRSRFPRPHRSALRSGRGVRYPRPAGWGGHPGGDDPGTARHHHRAGRAATCGIAGGRGMTDRRVVVTGLGVVSPHGSDPAAMFNRLMNGESAVREVSFDTDGPYSNVAAPADFDPAGHFPPQVRLENLDRLTQMSIVAATAAVADAAIDVTDGLRHRSGVSFGTGMGSTA